jgi:hypothetical protein
MRPAPDPATPDSFTSGDVPQFGRAIGQLQNDQALLINDFTLLTSVSFVVSRLEPVTILGRALILNSHATQNGGGTLFLVAGDPAKVVDYNYATRVLSGDATQIAADGNGTLLANFRTPRAVSTIWQPNQTGARGVALWVLGGAAGGTLSATGEQTPVIGAPFFGFGIWWPTAVEVLYPST